MSPETTVVKLLSADTDLLALTTRIRGHKPRDIPVYSSTPDFTNQTIQTIIDMSPWIRVTPIPGDDAIYADDQRVVKYPKVQLDYWVDKTKTADCDELEDYLYDKMHKAGWERYYRYSMIDGDTPQLRMVITQYQYQGLPLG